MDDFGDHHLFRMEVAKVREKAGPEAKYPRVAATVGEAPEQYPSPDW
ncbi:MAG: hypothetical protein ACYC99_17130 [Candidatus Geothermincolia bacterium]